MRHAARALRRHHVAHAHGASSDRSRSRGTQPLRVARALRCLARACVASRCACVAACLVSTVITPARVAAAVTVPPAVGVFG
jgi:hypothetical protein